MKELDFIMPNYFGSDLPPISQLEKRAQLAFISSNPAIDQLGPLPESVSKLIFAYKFIFFTERRNVIEILMHAIVFSSSWRHTYRRAKSTTQGNQNCFRNYQKILLFPFLYQDLESFVNSSKKGTVLFSLGSSLHSKNLPIVTQKLFTDIFSEFVDYHFLWKFESNITAEELPKNVRILPWIPQSDVLAHSKLKAFITHGGQHLQRLFLPFSTLFNSILSYVR